MREAISCVASSKLDRKWGVWPRLPAQPLTAFQPRRRDREKLLAREIWTWRHGEHESAHSVRSFRCHRHAGLLRARGSQPVVHLGVRGRMCAGVRLCLALRCHRGRLGRSCGIPLAFKNRTTSLEAKQMAPNQVRLAGAKWDAPTMMRRPRHAMRSRYQRRHFDSQAVISGAL
jgi:hypothetical protein